MKENYKTLGIKVGATLEEVEIKYRKLLKEFDPKKQSEDLKEFFKSEQEKVKSAYKEISLSLVSTENVEKEIDEINTEINDLQSITEKTISESKKEGEKKSKKDEKEVVDEFPDEERVLEEVVSDETYENLTQQTFSFKERAFVGLLLFIAIGIWGVFMQNMGFFVPGDDYTQKVRVVNTVDTEVQGTVNVNGSVSVDNTVDVNLTQIRGTRPWVNTSRTGAAVLGVFSENTTLRK